VYRIRAFDGKTEHRFKRIGKKNQEIAEYQDKNAWQPLYRYIDTKTVRAHDVNKGPIRPSSVKSEIKVKTKRKIKTQVTIFSGNQKISRKKLGGDLLGGRGPDASRIAPEH